MLARIRILNQNAVLHVRNKIFERVFLMVHITKFIKQNFKKVKVKGPVTKHTKLTVVFIAFSTILHSLNSYTILCIFVRNFLFQRTD
jgi:hypothetical protein